MRGSIRVIQKGKRYEVRIALGRDPRTGRYGQKSVSVRGTRGEARGLDSLVDHLLGTGRLDCGHGTVAGTNSVETASDPFKVAVLNGVMIRGVHAHGTNDERPESRLRIFGGGGPSFCDELSRRERGHPTIRERPCCREKFLTCSHIDIVLRGPGDCEHEKLQHEGLPQASV